MGIFKRLFSREKAGEKVKDSSLEKAVSEPTFLHERVDYYSMNEPYIPSFEQRLDQLAEKAKEIGLDEQFIGDRRYISRTHVFSEYYRKVMNKLLISLEKYFGIGNTVFLEEVDKLVKYSQAVGDIRWRGNADFSRLYDHALEDFKGKMNWMKARDLHIGTYLSHEKHGIAEVVETYKSKDEAVNRAVARGILNVLGDGDLGMDDSPIACITEIYKAIADEDLPSSVYEEIGKVILEKRYRWNEEDIGDKRTRRADKQKQMEAFAHYFTENLDELKQHGPEYITQVAEEVFK